MVRFLLKAGATPPARVSVTVNGRVLSLPEGQVLAAALLAEGISVFGRSAEANEPRGPLCLMGACYGCAVTVDGEPQTRACRARVSAGMTVELETGEGVAGRNTPAAPHAGDGR